MENLGIDYKLIIAQVINFTLFFLIFKKLFAKPFGKFLKEEKEKSLEQDKILANLKKDEVAMGEKSKKLEDQYMKKTQVMIDEAKDEVSAMKKQMIDEAREEVHEMKEKATTQMKKDKDEMEKEMQEKVLRLSFFIVEKTLKDILPEDAKKKITSAILKNLPKTGSLHEN